MSAPDAANDSPVPIRVAGHEPSARGPLFGCAFGIFGLIFFAALISWTLWQGLEQNKAIDAFTVPEPKVQAVEKLPEADALALDARLHAFTGALDAGTRAEVRVDAAALNHLIATDDRLADLRGQLHVQSIKDGVVVCSICYPLNGLPWDNRKRYLVGTLTLQPEFVDGNAAFRVTKLEVPGKSLPKWFTDQFSIYHLLERYQKDETVARRMRQLAALSAEGGEVVARTKAWKESQ